MAQTISELEKERAELLKAIENQAQQYSSGRTGQEAPSEQTEHTLKDWLNAAEEVMPSKPKAKSKPSSSQTMTTKSSQIRHNKASFFGVIIMLSLFLTILGVVYIAYTAIQKELEAVLSMKEETVKELQVLKETMTDIQQNSAAAGQGELFKQLQEKVTRLEQEIMALKAQKFIAQPSEDGEGQAASANSVMMNPLPDNVVTTQVLDAKLQEYTRGIDAKLEKILMALPQVQMDSPTSEKKTEASTLKQQSQVTVAEPQPPKLNQPSVKPLNQPVVRLVERVESPKEPTSAKAPLKNYSNDVKWLLNEPAFNFTLQLASMTERSSIQKMISDKELNGTKIIPQDRNGETRYVLVTGSYASRTDADNAARAYKANFGLTPWVRKIKDLSTKVK